MKLEFRTERIEVENTFIGDQEVHIREVYPLVSVYYCDNINYVVSKDSGEVLMVFTEDSEGMLLRDIDYRGGS